MKLHGLKRSADAAARRLAPEAIEASDAIWGFAEEAFQEFRSAALLRDVLARHGFELAQEFRKIPTAFAMAAGRGKPRIGILAEYDALPGCGLEAGTTGHGCGHNLLGGGSLLAALVAREMLAKRKLKGTIVLYGCPAEETLAGKVYMARDGAFADLDAALGWHPAASTHVALGGGSALDSYAFEFFGKTAHGAYAHGGRSALDAVELMDHAVNILREHIQENVRIHSVIRCGGEAPNVVPDYARSWLYARGRDREQVDSVAARILKCAKGAALATETKLKTTLLTAGYERLPNDALAEHLDTCLRTVGPPRFSRRDADELRELGTKTKFSRSVGAIDRSRGRASSDEDTVSWLTPLGVLRVATAPKGLTGHHRETTQVGRTRAAHRGMTQAGKSLAVAAVALMQDRKLLARVRKEFGRRTRGFSFDPLVPKRQLPPIRDTIPKSVIKPESMAGQSH